MNKNFGYFDDDRREYVITTPQTPYPWINYLGTDKFFSLISNTAGGYCFYRDAKFRRILRYRYNGVPMDAGGRYFYIREKDGSFWSPSWKPCKTPLDSYECRHGMGYTRISGIRNGLKTELLFFVPQNRNCEIHSVTLTNSGSSRKEFKFYSFVEWCLWNASTDMENFQRNLSTGEVEVADDGAVLYHKTEYRERRNHYAFYACNAPVAGFDTDRESFIGLYNGFDAPDMVVRGESGKSVAHGWSPVASHCLSISLDPGETRRIDFILGYVENPDSEKFESLGKINEKPARDIITSFDSHEKIDSAFDSLRRYWDNLLGKFTLECEDSSLCRMVNIWNQYQCMVTFNMSRSASFFESGIGRGMGFRDSNQDLAGFVHHIPEKARERILDIAATQFPDGSCYHQYQPLSKRGNNDIGAGFGDDPLWLIFGTTCYIKETGDFSILEEMVPFDNVPGSEKTLFEHLTISLDKVAGSLGPHSLPLIGRADWNDCLNLNCFSNDPNESFQTTENKSEGSKAESLMIAGLFIVEAREYAALCSAYKSRCAESSFAETLGKEAERASKLASDMSDAVCKYGWDGEWFLRAYDYYGRPVGTSAAEEGKIFVESQGWCTIARVGAEKGHCAKALDSVKKYLDCEQGIVLNNPAFTKYIPDYGEISSYPEGYKENAGVFCHNNPWIIIGETLEGRGDDAWTHYRKICPAYISDHQRHKLEPYVYSQMIAGKDAACPGEAKNSWLTGTAAWNWLAVTQYILGIKTDYDALEINPCIPSTMKTYKVVRRFRDAEYTIEVENPRGVCRAEAPVRIPYSPGKHSVKIVL